MTRKRLFNVSTLFFSTFSNFSFLLILTLFFSTYSNPTTNAQSAAALPHPSHNDTYGSPRCPPYLTLLSSPGRHSMLRSLRWCHERELSLCTSEQRQFLLSRSIHMPEHLERRREFVKLDLTRRTRARRTTTRPDAQIPITRTRRAPHTALMTMALACRRALS